MKENILARDDVDRHLTSRSRGADARQCPRGVDNAARTVVRLLEDGDQVVDEAEKTFFGRRLVVDSLYERP